MTGLAYMTMLADRRGEVALELEFHATNRFVRMLERAQSDAAGLALWMAQHECHFQPTGLRCPVGVCVDCDEWHAASRALALTVRNAS